MKQWKQTILFLLCCAVVACQPAKAEITELERTELYVIESCLDLGETIGNTDMLYAWSDKLTKFVARTKMSNAQLKIVIGYTRDIMSMVDYDTQELGLMIDTCNKEIKDNKLFFNY